MIVSMASITEVIATGNAQFSVSALRQLAKQLLPLIVIDAVRRRRSDGALRQYLNTGRSPGRVVTAATSGDLLVTD